MNNTIQLTTILILLIILIGKSIEEKNKTMIIFYSISLGVWLCGLIDAIKIYFK